jgi:hypothetical protein
MSLLSGTWGFNLNLNLLLPYHKHICGLLTSTDVNKHFYVCLFFPAIHEFPAESCKPAVVGGPREDLSMDYGTVQP